MRCQRRELEPRHMRHAQPTYRPAANPSRRDRVRIARRFNAGIRTPQTISPEGTADTTRTVRFQPSLRDSSFSFTAIPALKRRAILILSLRDKVRHQSASIRTNAIHALR